MHILKILCRLVYTKCPLFLNMESRPHQKHPEKRVRRLAKTRMSTSGQTMENLARKLASSLRRTNIIKKRHFPASVSSTPSAHSKIEYRLAYGFFCKSDVSSTPNAYLGRQEQSRTGPGHSNLASLLQPIFPPPSSPFVVCPGKKLT